MTELLNRYEADLAENPEKLPKIAETIFELRVISRGAPEFWQRYQELPPEIQAATRKAYRLFNTDPAHSSLRLERL